VRIVRLANFITPCSGGLRTALRGLGAGYAAAGHEPVLVMPGAADHDEQTPQGRVITLRGPVLPLSGGYRLLLSKRRVRAILESLRPERLEVFTGFIPGRTAVAAARVRAAPGRGERGGRDQRHPCGAASTRRASMPRWRT
jgi:hypothetical protein